MRETERNNCWYQSRLFACSLALQLPAEQSLFPRCCLCNVWSISWHIPPLCSHRASIGYAVHNLRPETSSTIQLCAAFIRVTGVPMTTCHRCVFAECHSVIYDAARHSKWRKSRLTVKKANDFCKKTSSITACCFNAKDNALYDTRMNLIEPCI